MKDDSSTNDNSSAGWRVYVPAVYSSAPPPRPTPVGITADVGVPPQLRNREALIGFILGIVGTDWDPAAPGLPPVAVYGLTLSVTSRVLYAATHGRGAYRLTL